MKRSGNTFAHRAGEIVRAVRAKSSFSSTRVARTLGLVAICSALFVGGLGQAANTGFVYDDLGRLIQVVAPDGTTTQHAYDAAGNITAVRADAANTLAVTSFSPGSGPAGTSVTIFGSGFSTTASANSVKFNGVAAVVTAASATTLQVTVPAAATTGAISVINTNGTAVSATNFVVGVGAVSPTITGFTPSLGLAGTAVTITGTGFQSAAEANSVAFGSIQGPVTSVTAPTQIVATAPQAGSGKVSVTTADGTALSAGEFYVVPTGVLPSTIVDTQRIVPDGAAVTTNLGTAGGASLLTFDAVAGQRLGLGVGSFTAMPASGSPQLVLSVYTPTGAVLGSCTITAANKCTLPAIPKTGTYRLLARIDVAHTANVSLLLTSEQTGVLTANATVTTFATSRVGQNGRYTFSATAGQNLSLAWSGTTFAGSYTSLTVYGPSGNTVTSQSTSNGYYPNGVLQLNNLQQSGTYTVFVDPYQASTGQVGLQLLASAGGTLTVDGMPLAISQMAGATGRYSFTGSAGQALGLGLGTLVTTPTGGTAVVTVVAPDNVNTLVSCGGFPAPGSSCNLPVLPSSGTYTVVVTPSTSSTALTGNLTLSTDVADTLTANAPATTFATSRVGQNGRYTFIATAGQNLSLAWSGATFTGSNGYLYVYGPNGTTVASNTTVSSSTPNGVLQLTNLQQSGTYTVFMDPYQASTGQVGLQLLAPASGTLAVDGAPLAISQMAGATGRYSFAGSAGQRLGLGVDTLVTTPSGGTAAVTVIAPDNVTTLVSCGSVAAAGNSCNLPALPSSGTYTVVVAPSTSSTALAGNLTLSSDVADTLTANAPATTFATSRVGQNGRYTFSATAGQNLSLAWSGTTFVGSYTSLTVYGPSGNTVTSQSISNSYIPNGVLQLTNLQQSGTYTVFVDPYQASTGQVGLQLLAPASGTLAVDGAPLAISQMAGATGRYSFTGIAGQRLGLGVDTLVTTPSGGYAAITVIAPDSVTTLIGCGNPSAPGNSCNLPVLPSSGTYTVVVTPGSSSTALAGNLTLSTDLADTLTADAPVTTFATSRVGQNGRYTFNATAGQNLSLVWSGATFVGTHSYLYVYGPSGNTVISQYFSSGTPNGVVQLTNLQQSGTYTVFVDPYQASTGQVGLQLLTPASGTLAVDGAPLAINQMAGATGRYTFAGTTGDFFNLGLSGAAITPAGGSVTVTVIAPDNVTTLVTCGTFTKDGSCSIPTLSNNGANNVGLPSTGIYTVLVTPGTYATAVSGSLTLTRFSVRP